jgi:putative transferase (TIGR04331 family)
MKKEKYNKRKKLCLVVTQGKDYYSKNKDNVFLKKKIFDSLSPFNINSKYQIIDNSIPDNYIKKNILFVQKKLETYKKDLTKILNLYHKIENNDLYWGIILDSWLVHVISVIKIKADELLLLNKKNIYIYESNNSFIFNNSENFLIESAVNDDFNQFVYSRIAKNLGIETKKKKKTHSKKNKKSKDFSLFNYFAKFFFKIYIRLFSPVILADSYFKRPVIFFLYSLGKILVIPSKLIFFSNYNSSLDYNFRENIRVTEKDKFDKLFNLFLGSFLPKSLIEDYKLILIDYNIIIRCIKKLGSAIGIHTNDIYKVIAAELTLKKKYKIFGFQHGASYNCQNLNLIEYVEKKNCTKYFYWKNKEGLGLNYLHAIKKVSEKNLERNKNIVLYLSLQKKYINRFEYQMDYNDIKKNINRYFSFYDNLDLKLKSHFLLKPYPNSYKWNSSNIWLDRYGQKINIIKNVSSTKVLQNTKIFVTDKINTPYIESMYSNIPTFVFTNIEEHSFRINIKKLFYDLKNIGLIYENPKDCANFINSEYDNIVELWNSPKVKKLIKNLSNELFTINNNFIHSAIKKLK